MRLLRLGRKILFNLGITLCCGQVFRWELRSGWWYGVVRGRVWKTRQVNDSLEYDNTSENEMLDYFGLRDNLPRILKEISKDHYAKDAVEGCRGLRILHQEPWECLISYICATYKSIPAIKRMLDQLSIAFGEKIAFESHEFYAFPEPERLATASASELTRCGLGYRTRYVEQTAKIIRKNRIDLDSLKSMPYDKARKELLKLPGVGPKVADCVLLFSLGRTEAFPVDVWMKRVILRHYAEHLPPECVRRLKEKKTLSNTEYAQLSLFGKNYFGKYAGYAQEYLYHYERTHKPMNKRCFVSEMKDLNAENV